MEDCRQLHGGGRGTEVGGKASSEGMRMSSVLAMLRILAIVRGGRKRGEEVTGF